MAAIKMKARSESLKAARQARSLSQRQVADIVTEITGKRFPEITYNKIEAAERPADLSHAVVIAQIVGQDLGQVFSSADQRVKLGNERV